MNKAPPQNLFNMIYCTLKSQILKLNTMHDTFYYILPAATKFKRNLNDDKIFSIFGNQSTEK